MGCKQPGRHDESQCQNVPNDNRNASGYRTSDQWWVVINVIFRHRAPPLTLRRAYWSPARKVIGHN
jgi:hypothetical protein